MAIELLITLLVKPECANGRKPLLIFLIENLNGLSHLLTLLWGKNGHAIQPPPEGPMGFGFMRLTFWAAKRFIIQAYRTADRMSS